MNLRDPATGIEMRPMTRLSFTVQISALAVLFGSVVNASGHRARDPLHAVYFVALAASTGAVTWALSRFVVRATAAKSIGVAALLGAVGGAVVGALVEPISSRGATLGGGSPAPPFSLDGPLSGGIVGVALAVASSSVLAHHFSIARRPSLDFAPRLAMSVGAPVTLVSLLMAMASSECWLGVIAGAAMVGLALWLRARRSAWVERVMAGREAGYRVIDASGEREASDRADASAIDVKDVPRFAGNGEPGGSVLLRESAGDELAKGGAKPIAVALIESDAEECEASADEALGGAIAWGFLAIVLNAVVVVGLLILMAMAIGG